MLVVLGKILYMYKSTHKKLIKYKHINYCKHSLSFGGDKLYRKVQGLSKGYKIIFKIQHTFSCYYESGNKDCDKIQTLAFKGIQSLVLFCPTSLKTLLIYFFYVHSITSITQSPKTANLQKDKHFNISSILVSLEKSCIVTVHTASQNFANLFPVLCWCWLPNLHCMALITFSLQDQWINTEGNKQQSSILSDVLIEVTLYICSLCDSPLPPSPLEIRQLKRQN